MFLAACLCCLLNLPLVSANGWDDFANNLATDLAPFLSLFGEQITKQYLSESITQLDYFIFAMAPMGILTAVISAIRVCGSPSLRAFIGRAQEGGGNAEAELCSSTSRDVCELYNNGGIARVFGRPKILEVVHDPVKPDFNGAAGIYTFREYLRSGNGEDEWEDEQKDIHDTERNIEPDAFAPNLSLNVGIKRQPPSVFWTVAMAGLILQAGVLIFAIFVTYYLRWEKDGTQPESYACPLMLIGTIVVCAGNFHCASLVGQSTKEQIFRRKPQQNQRPKASSLYWIQPGGQSLGDQIFDSFCYSDGDKPLDEYITSWKNRSEDWAQNSELLVWVAVGTTVSGFILQFVGLRGIHSAVSVAQLGVTMVMSALRAALRMQRLKPDDNFLRRCLDEVVGHELDWLAMRIGGEDIYLDLKLSPSLTASFSASDPSRRYFWRFCGTPSDAESIKRERPPSLADPNAAEKLLAYRARLAHLTQPSISQTSAVVSAEEFNITMVEVRESAQRLAQAIESAASTIFSNSPKIKTEWQNAESMYWGMACEVACKELPRNSALGKAASESRKRHTIYLRLNRESPGNLWRLQNKLELEALLGLWLWSLKSDPAVEVSDLRTKLTLSRATKVPARRIVSTSRHVAETDLKIWLGGAIPKFMEDVLRPTSPNRGDVSTIWEQATEEHNYHEISPSGLPEQLDHTARYFGWHATEASQSQGPNPFTVWSASTNSFLLSLCVQEVFGSFIKSIFDIVEDFGAIDVQQETQHFRLENRLVSDLARLFNENQLGPREDALLCILPPIIPRLTLSSAGSALAAARKSANQHRRRDQWEQAETVLRWAWGTCCGLQSSVAGTNQPNFSKDAERAAIALGELYRWALCNDMTKKFGLDGIRWLSETGHRQSLPATIKEIIDRYSSIVKGVNDPARSGSSAQLSPTFGDDLTATLLSLTLSTSLTNEERGRALCSTAKHGWAEVVLALLELGAEPDYKDPDEDSRTALSHAAQNGHIDVVKELMEGGAFPDSADAKHRTPLSYAAEMGHSAVVEILLRDQRVEPDAKDAEGRTPLWQAARKGEEEIIKMLLDRKVDPGSKDDNGRTPLLQATEKGHEAIVELFIGCQVDLDVKDVDGRTPLSRAVESDNEAIVKLLVDCKVDADARDKNGRTPLWYAVRKGNKEIVKLLLDCKVDPDARDQMEGTPLLWALERGDEAIVQLLLDRDVNPDAKDKNGRTPLLWVAGNSNEKMVKILLDTGKVDPNAKDSGGNTALLHAAAQNNEAIVRLLLNTGKVEADARSYNGRTPLLEAASLGNQTIVKLLLDTGKVDPHFKSAKGETPLLWAARDGNRAIVEQLLGIGKADLNTRTVDGETPLLVAASYNKEAIIRLLLNIPEVNPDIRNKDGRTPLFLAALSGNLAVMRLLLGTGRTDPDARDNWGNTPLSWAVGKEQADIIKLLLDTGKVNLSARVDGGRTLLSRAAERDVSIVKLLLDTGKVDPDIKDEDGRTPLWWATQRGNGAIVELLLATGKVEPIVGEKPKPSLWRPS